LPDGVSTHLAALELDLPVERENPSRFTGRELVLQLPHASTRLAVGVAVTVDREALREHVLHHRELVAAAALGFIGHGYGLGGTRRFVSTALISALIVLVLAVILDLDRPRRGFIKVSQDSMVRWKETLDATVPSNSE
jgi:hypothetical protein